VDFDFEVEFAVSGIELPRACGEKIQTRTGDESREQLAISARLTTETAIDLEGGSVLDSGLDLVLDSGVDARKVPGCDHEQNAAEQEQQRNRAPLFS
jgi:hypothetical protein